VKTFFLKERRTIVWGAGAATAPSPS
jgi:hypothetical protein